MPIQPAAEGYGPATASFGSSRGMASEKLPHWGVRKERGLGHDTKGKVWHTATREPPLVAGRRRPGVAMSVGHLRPGPALSKGPVPETSLSLVVPVGAQASSLPEIELSVCRLQRSARHTDDQPSEAALGAICFSHKPPPPRPPRMPFDSST